MGVELELHTGRPILDWRRSRKTFLRGSYAYGDELTGLLLLMADSGPGVLPHVDPYGDTTLDEQQAAAALREIPEMMTRCTSDAQVAAVQDLRSLLRACTETPGSYLWFVGD
ncbi:hypothetical protein [Streptomyces sp. TR02-1]|uniref:hypothetical protein n=1 Tax=Streptomyces sp. TR02-1 TaxID=3385977 RepID=UPI0039A0A4D4